MLTENMNLNPFGDVMDDDLIAKLKKFAVVEVCNRHLDNVRYELIEDDVLAEYGEPESDAQFDIEKIGDNQYMLTFHDLDYLRDRDIAMACGEYDDYQRTAEAIVKRAWWFNGF